MWMCDIWKLELYGCTGLDLQLWSVCGEKKVNQIYALCRGSHFYPVFLYLQCQNAITLNQSFMFPGPMSTVNLSHSHRLVWSFNEEGSSLTSDFMLKTDWKIDLNNRKSMEKTNTRKNLMLGKIGHLLAWCLNSDLWPLINITSCLSSCLSESPDWMSVRTHYYHKMKRSTQILIDHFILWLNFHVLKKKHTVYIFWEYKYFCFQGPE